MSMTSFRTSVYNWRPNNQSQNGSLHC